jgi:hypothetical protein
MALQTSGAISLNDIHIEAANSYHSGSNCTINDADIRALIGKSSGATMSFNEWYGASSSLDTQTVTVNYAAATQYVPAIAGFYNISGTDVGSVSDGTCNFKSGATYRRLQWTSQNFVFFALNGSHANSGWTTMSIAGTNFSRTSASFQVINSTETRWTWSSISTNPFGTTTGATKSVVFT